ncbi:MAG: protease pro-enzyme activation domain-containing protein, partial [Terracidiphilus sp.]
MAKLVRGNSFCIAILVVTGWVGMAWGQQTGNRIVGPIDESRVVTLKGNVHPLAREEYDLGGVDPDLRMDRMVLELMPGASRQAELDTLVEAQQDVESPLFHAWLTPSEFGARFGASPADVTEVAAWLQGRGFTVDEVAASNWLIVFSGTAGEVETAFHTEIHRYRVDGVEHIANSQDPEIPAALAGVVGGVVSLHDFRRRREIAARKEMEGAPVYSSGNTHYLFPADWATIYDLNPLYAAGMSGEGISIAVAGRSNINVSDVAAFRAGTGLAVNDPTVIVPGTNPGLVAG